MGAAGALLGSGVAIQGRQKAQSLAAEIAAMPTIDSAIDVLL